MLKSSVQIGDGSFPTYFDASATLSSFDAAKNSSTQVEVNIPASTLELRVKAAAGDTINLTACSAVAPQVQTLIIDSASDVTTASYSTIGTTVVGAAATWKTGVPITNATFKSCPTVAFKGASPDTVTITDTAATSTQAACSFDANPSSAITDCVFDGTGAGYAIELGTAVTAITLTDCTITAGSTDKVHVLKTTGTVTITISGTTSLAAGDVTSAGATVVISAPALYQSVVVSGFTAGSRIQIYDTTNSIELFNGTASAGDTVVSGTTATWTDPVAAAGNRAIRVRVAYVSGVTAKMWQENTGLTCGTTSGTAGITYPITMVDDDTYNNNGINGPSIYATSGITFTDAATDLVNISIAGGTVSWPTIYACFVYWLFTAAGIDDDVAYIDAPDTANYLLTSMKIKNTHANPLTVTGGYGRSATTGLVADIIDTAGSTGNIFPSPDHVVAYATGSGSLTAGDITNIWAASTRTITTTIPAAADNASALLAAAVDGSTTVAESIRLANAVLGGKVSGAGTGTETFRDLADTKDRVVATVDTSGNRTAITRTLT